MDWEQASFDGYRGWRAEAADGYSLNLHSVPGQWIADVYYRDEKTPETHVLYVGAYPSNADLADVKAWAERDAARMSEVRPQPPPPPTPEQDAIERQLWADIYGHAYAARARLTPSIPPGLDTLHLQASWAADQAVAEMRRSPLFARGKSKAPST